MTKKSHFLFALLLWAFLKATPALGQDVEKTLNDQYRDRVLVLRHSFESNSQEYAADGTPLKTANEGSWTLYGRIRVNKIKADAKQLILEGTRAMYVFDKTGVAMQIPADRKHPAEKLKVKVQLQQPFSSVDEASAVLGRVFALAPEDILNAAPAYWRSQLAKQMGLKPASGAARQGEETNQAQGKITSTADPSVFRIGDHGVKAPRILYKQEPVFTEAARNRQFQGVVGLNILVDSTGKVANVSIVHPIGMGLDDSAVATVSTWRFTPAMKDGQPFAVPLYVEVDFRLY